MSEEKVDLDQIEENSLDTEAYLQKEIEDENNHAINYRNCSWQRTAGLLFSEYICLAIMSFPWSYSVLGLGLGLILLLLFRYCVFTLDLLLLIIVQHILI